MKNNYVYVIPGVITAGYTVTQDAIKIAFSICNSTDTFVKAVGRSLVDERLKLDTDGEYNAIISKEQILAVINKRVNDNFMKPPIDPEVAKYPIKDSRIKITEIDLSGISHQFICQLINKLIYGSPTASRISNRFY